MATGGSANTRRQRRPKAKPSVAATASLAVAMGLGLASLPSAGAVATAAADAPSGARVEVAPRAAAPVLDGRISPGEWADTARVRGLVRSDGVGVIPADLWIGASKGALHIAIRLPLGDPASLLTRAPATGTADSLAPLDDSLELWLAPGGESRPEHGYRIVFNARGARWEARYQRDGDEWRAAPGAPSPARLSTRVAAGAWEAELTLPWGGIEPHRFPPDNRWWLRIARQERRPSRRAAWPAEDPAGDPFAYAAQLRVRPDAISVSLSDDQVAVSNHAPTPTEVLLRVEPASACPELADRALRFDGGGRELIALPPDCPGRRPRLEVFEVGEVVPRFAAQLLPVAGARAEGGRPIATRGVRFDVGYYPYASSLRVRVDAAAAQPPLSQPQARATLDVVPETGGEPVLTRTLAVSPHEPLEIQVPLPRLADGRYRAQLALDGGGGVPLVLERFFAHRTFGWERNDLGRESEVIPPFEPLRVSGRAVDAVLRRHLVGEDGLLEQIESVGRPLLAAPMRFELHVAGSEAVPRAQGPPQMNRKEPGEVAYTAGWRAGPLRAEVRGRFEVDGMLLLELHLPEQSGVVVERIDLVVPLRSEVATLMNAVTDRTRHNFAGAIPSGRGLVWDSTRAERVELPGSLVPYVWLGDEVRGLAWFATGTRDWVLDPDAPVQTLERGPRSIDLRVRLVGRPQVLSRPRRMVFGLQATPTKPAALQPRWRLWQPRCTAPPPIQTLCMLGTSWDWGGATAFGDFYPAPGNEGILDALGAARRTGRIAPGEVDAWLRRRRVRHPSPEKERGGLDSGFRAMAARPDAVVAYVNAHNVAPIPEFEIYADEWSATPFADRNRPPLPLDELHPTFPTESWQDFALWHLRRLLEAGVADGFYFDNTALRAIFDDVSGSAYRDDDGGLQPALDLLELRDFLRRAQVMAYHMRGRWLNVSHMSNTPIAPIHTWSAAILDGELRYGAKPFPQRFSRDWLRAESLGTQVGSLPIFLPGVTGVDRPERRRELEISVVAGTSVHEIRVFGGANQPAQAVWELLYRFGYGQDDCRVLRYWDRPRRFQLSGVDAEALVLVRGQRALALVASFGAGGAAELALDGEALGLAPGGRCREADSKNPVASAGAFTCRFDLPGFGLRLITWTED